jgi:hypothetical protein
MACSFIALSLDIRRFFFFSAFSSGFFFERFFGDRQFL